MWFGARQFSEKVQGAEQHISLLGKGAKFKGTITFEGTARIDGRLEGDISTEGTLIVGQQAVIEGNIAARRVISEGKITGDVVASERVQFAGPAVMIGKVKTPLLSLAEGVSFRGTSEVESTMQSGITEEFRKIVTPDSVAGDVKLGAARSYDGVPRKSLIPWSQGLNRTSEAASSKASTLPG